MPSLGPLRPRAGSLYPPASSAFSRRLQRSDRRGAPAPSAGGHRWRHSSRRTRGRSVGAVLRRHGHRPAARAHHRALRVHERRRTSRCCWVEHISPTLAAAACESQRSAPIPFYVSGQWPSLDAACSRWPPTPASRRSRSRDPGQAAALALSTQAWTLGWGRLHARPAPAATSTSPTQPRQLQLPVPGDDACQNAYGIGFEDFPYRPAWLLCAGAGDGRNGPCRRQPRSTRRRRAGLMAQRRRLERRRSLYHAAVTSISTPRRPHHPVHPQQQSDEAAGSCRAAADHSRPVAHSPVRRMRRRWHSSPARFSSQWTASETALIQSSAAAPSPCSRPRDASHGVSCIVTAADLSGHNTIVARPLRPHRRSSRLTARHGQLFFFFFFFFFFPGVPAAQSARQRASCIARRA